ncbi:MAG TPA: 5-dehydro-2-deoxygluconokinase [Ilumatobacteraceae bacterium]
MTDLDLITVGRVSVDLYAREAGAGFEEAQTFEKSVGGSPTNVAVAAARLGHRAAVATKVGDDPFGRYVRRKLEYFGVDTRFVGTHPTLRTPLAFAAMDPPDDPPILFYREPDAPDMTIAPDELDAQSVRDVPIFWVSASALSRDPIAGTVGALLAERSRRRHTVLDLDYRPAFWASEADAREHIGGAVKSCTVAVGNRTECDIAVGSADPDTAADRLLERGAELAIVKRGGDGVLVAWSDGRTVVPAQRVEVVCGLGAGDAFGGALCHGLLSGWDPRQMVEYANAAGAIVASRLLCSDAMPFDDEVGALLGRSDAPG